MRALWIVGTAVAMCLSPAAAAIGMAIVRDWPYRRLARHAARGRLR